ncbi:MAG: hypothetical protein F6K19_48465 [Cyanothece sp. SIO1E1]|nr:hypothetical protein [Cyanothece sp. SIO1E1]
MPWTVVGEAQPTLEWVIFGQPTVNVELFRLTYLAPAHTFNRIHGRVFIRPYYGNVDGNVGPVSVFYPKPEPQLRQIPIPLKDASSEFHVRYFGLRLNVRAYYGLPLPQAPFLIRLEAWFDDV